MMTKITEAPTEKQKVAYKDLCEFSEWAALNYIRLHGVWVHRYQSQTDQKNWITTNDLFIFWWNNFRGTGLSTAEVQAEVAQ